MGLRTRRHHQHHGSHAPDHLNAMKPGSSAFWRSEFPVHCVERQTNRHDQPKLTKLTVLVVPMRLVLPSTFARPHWGHAVRADEPLLG